MSSFSRSGHQFGGSWTEKKLDVLEKYLKAYLTALKKQPFELVYIDGFAGDGYRVTKPGDPLTVSSLSLFEREERAEPRQLLEGSARRALRLDPPFHKYIFIEQSPRRVASLQRLAHEFAHLAARIEVHQADANTKIKQLATASWTSRRAVLFLDPYGMQVEWSTLEAVAQSRAIDLWLLFPLGAGVLRLLTRSGEIEESWRHRVNLLLGTQDWYDELYRVETQPTLFGEQEQIVRAGADVIGKYFIRRLKGLFAGVVPSAGVLRNSRNNPLYLLMFAVANPRGAELAMKIASDLLKDMERL